MYKILTGNYQQGHLVLDEALDSDWEGKKLHIVVYEADNFSTKQQEFFDLVDRHSFDLPLDYKFDRDELHG
ncbi:MAG: hypothetical protein HLUCCO16_19760 [Phormidium sp. OSCR]|nr:MAG: hypothetical protein HLUCCO16_19760 [Phormidium sp. OSCR]